MTSGFDERYAEPAYAYGTEPNEFLRECAPRLPRGPVLCLAEGQGRNAVYIAGRGHQVVAVDRSAVGLSRARDLARARGVPITCIVTDLADYRIAAGTWSGIVAIFAHLPPELRRAVHRQVVEGLTPGGLYVLEAYTPAQLRYDTGGPRDVELLMSLDVLRTELAGLDLIIGREVERDVIEGKYHTGRAAVVQLLARRPIEGEVDSESRPRPGPGVPSEPR